MSREERRKKARLDKKSNDKKAEALRWMNSLPPEKWNLVQSYANMIAKRDNETFIGALQRCYSAAIISQLEDIEFSGVENIIEEFSYLMKEDAEKMKKLKEKCGGDMVMATKKVNEKENDVLKKATSLIKEGKKQKEAIEILVSEFPMLSKAMLTNAYKRVKANLSEENKSIKNVDKVKEVPHNSEIDIEKAAEYILEENKEIKKEEKEVTEKQNTDDPDFEIINKVIDLKGRHAIYHVERNVLVIDDEIAFQSREEIKKWASEEREKIAKLMIAINEKENEALKVMSKFM